MIQERLPPNGDGALRSSHRDSVRRGKRPTPRNQPIGEKASTTFSSARVVQHCRVSLPRPALPDRHPVKEDRGRAAAKSKTYCSLYPLPTCLSLPLFCSISYRSHCSSRLLLTADWRAPCSDGPHTTKKKWTQAKRDETKRRVVGRLAKAGGGGGKKAIHRSEAGVEGREA